jgi:hypothetical protein
VREKPKTLFGALKGSLEIVGDPIDRLIIVTSLVEVPSM